MGKRPQGLHKAALAKKKKQRTEAQAEAVADVDPVADDVEEAGDEEVTFQFDKDVDPNNELESLFAIYESYLSLSFAPKLLYLLIHTSDNILRLHSKKLERKESAQKIEKSEGGDVDPIDLIPEVLPAEFHNIYAISLLAMSRVVGEEEEEEDEKETTDLERSQKDLKRDVAKDSAKDFIEAALERVNAGLEQYPDSYELLFTRARANVVKIAEQLKRDTFGSFESHKADILSSLTQALGDFEKAEKAVLADSSKKYSEQELTTIQLLVGICEHIENTWISDPFDEGDEEGEEEIKRLKELELLRSTYLDWCLERYTNMAKFGADDKGKTTSTASAEKTKKTPFQIQREANLGIGKYYLVLAAPFLEKFELAAENLSDDDEDDDSEIEIENANEDDKDDEGKGDKPKEGENGEEDDESKESNELQHILKVNGEKAREYMTKSVEYLLKSENEEDGENLALIAEAQLSLSNVLDDSSEQTLLYKEAALRLKRAQRLGAGDFTELIRDLQQ